MSGSALVRFKVTPDGAESYELDVYSRDVLMWEKTGHGRSFSVLMKQQDMRELYALAHAASNRQGLFVGTLAKFEETCDLENMPDAVEGDEVEADPTPRAPSRARRSRSR